MLLFKIGGEAFGGVRAGHAGPYGELKEIGAASGIGIPPALRRHLPLTREAGGGLQYN